MNDNIEIWKDIALIKDDKYFARWVKETGRLDHHLGFLDYLLPYLGGVCVDVGANIGTHAIYYSKIASHIHCFEPNPVAFECLKHNMRDTDATLYNMAVGAEPEYIHMSPQEDGNPGAMYTISGGDIPVVTLDSLYLPECHYIKIDVEGSEVDVLMGAKDTINRCKPYLCIECNPVTLKRKGLTPNDLIATIHLLGYVCKQKVSPVDTVDLLAEPA